MSSSIPLPKQQESQKFGVFHDYDLKEVKFDIDNIKYTWNTRHMVWTTELLQNYEQAEQAEEDLYKKRSNKQVDVRNVYNQNKKQINTLLQETEKLSENLRKYQERLTQSQTEQQNLIEEYVQEHLETEKVKAARERLEKLKKELGL